MGCVEMRLLSRDQTDYPPTPMRPSNWDIVCLLFSIVFHIVDLITDVNVAKDYYIEGEFYYFLVTIFILLIPSVVNSCVSYRMYHMDSEKEVSYTWNRKMKWRVVMLLLQLAPVLRYIDSLKFACKSRKAEKMKNKEEQERYYKLMLKEDADVALLRVFECFLESAPQQILQISYLLKLYQKTNIEHGFLNFYSPLLSAVSSFAGMALSLMNYQRNIRFVQEDKDNVSYVGSLFIFFWHLFVTISRILMLSSMVYITWLWSLVSMIVHWIVMTISLSLLESHEFCSSSSSIQFQQFRPHEKICNVMFSSVLGLVYIFTYITPGEGGTFKRYLGFYLTCLVENISGAAIWYFYSATDSWFTIMMTVFCVLPFIVGCVFMIVYHLKFHPKHYIPPSIIPQRRQKKESVGTQLPDTPSPKAKVQTNNTHNGTVLQGSGDDDTAFEVKRYASQEEAQPSHPISANATNESSRAQIVIEPSAVGNEHEVQPLNSKCKV